MRIIKKINKKTLLEDILINNESLKTLKKIPSSSIDLVITSPPYFLNKEYEKHLTSFKEYSVFIEKIIKELVRVVKPSGAIFWNVGQTIINNEVIPLGALHYPMFKKHDLILKNWIIWHYNGGPNTKNRLSGRYENLFWFIKNNNEYTFNLDSIRVPAKWHMDPRVNPLGKNPTDVWNIFRVTNNSKERYGHPAQFPEKLIDRIVKGFSNPGDLILDPFMGSGTTAVVSKRLNRKWIGIELDDKYCEQASRRYEDEMNKNK